ncbi:MAG TPA: ComEC/Rec2 family competence protein, partial [Thiolinea sp.]|nr:ComEC/Rec2 family competence protein [Thiolinea sp.]
MRGLAVSSFLGIFSLNLLTNLPDKSWCLPLCVTLAILIAGLLRLLPLGRKFLLYPICFLLSFSYAYWAASSVLQGELPQVWEGKDLQVVGKIQDLPEKLSTGTSFLFKVDKVLAVDGKTENSTNFTGLVRVTWYPQQQETLPDLHAGEQWQFVMRAKRPNGLRNPGGFDYERWLFSQRIVATAYVRGQEEPLRLAAASSLAIDPYRERISQAIKQALGEQPNTSLIQGLAVSDTAGITKEQWKVLQATGTAHLLSISGLHISMVAGLGLLPIMLIWWLVPRLYLYLPARLVGGVLGAFFASSYALLAGFNIPTQRSL